MIAGTRSVLNHDDGVGTTRRSRAGHNRDRLSRPDCRNLRHARSDFANDLQNRGQALNISGSQRVAITRGPRKRRKVAVSKNRLG